MQNGNLGCRFLGLRPLPVGEGWGEGISPHGLLTVFLNLLNDVGG